MIRFAALASLIGFWTNAAIGGDGLLAHGDPAPRFEAGVFLRGPAVAGLARGTTYVIEFSGTQCVPCREAIPHLEDLRRKYPDVVFVTVFPEPIDIVRRFLEGAGKDITLRVACDPDQALVGSWSGAAGQFGIPHAFLVDAEGKIAWVGPPGRLDGPLARVAAGEPVESTDVVEDLRRLIEKRRLRTEELARQADAESRSRVSPLIKQGDLGAAVLELDRIIATYKDDPEAIIYPRARKLAILGLIRGRGEEVSALALEMAADARSGGIPSPIVAANTLMNHYVTCLPENRDERMIRLALALIGEDTRSDQPSPRSLASRSEHFQALSRAYDLQRDKERAVACLRQAVAAETEARERLRSAGATEEAQGDAARRIAELTARLEELSKKP